MSHSSSSSLVLMFFFDLPPVRSGALWYFVTLARRTLVCSYMQKSFVVICLGKKIPLMSFQTSNYAHESKLVEDSLLRSLLSGPPTGRCESVSTP